MKTLLSCLVVTLMACGSKSKPAAAPQNHDMGSAAGSAAQCCCNVPDKQAAFMAPAECTGAGGTCEATEDSCHGIEGPIP